MPFSAINTYEQELKQRNERHTLELQLEQAMQLYQQALELQRVHDVTGAHRQYDKLFAFDVLKPSKLPEKQKSSLDVGADAMRLETGGIQDQPGRSLQLGPAIRLRAMALKNYALLLISDANVEEGLINKALGCLCEALELVGTSDNEKLILPSLISILWSAGLKRLARLGLEVLAESSGGSALVPLDEWTRDPILAERLFGPRTIDGLKSLDFVKLELLDPSTGHTPTDVPTLLSQYLNLRETCHNQASLSETLERDGRLELNLASKSWSSVSTCINEALAPASRRKRKQMRDPYSWSLKDYWIVEFVGAYLHSFESGSDVDVQAHTPSKLEQTVGWDTQEPQEVQDPPQSLDLEEPRETNEPHDDFETCPVTPPRRVNSLSSPLASPEPTFAHQVLHSPKPEIVSELATQPLLTASPVKRRRIDRVKRSSLALPADFGVVDARFTTQINAYLALANLSTTLQFHSPAQLFLEPSQPVIPELTSALKLRDLLSAWDARESSQLLQEAASAESQRGGIMTTLKKGNRSEGTLMDSEDEDDVIQGETIIDESQEVEQFLTLHNGAHIQQIRWHLACKVLDKLVIGGQSKAFGRFSFNCIADMEITLWERRTFLACEQRDAIFALLADHWIQTKDAEWKVRMTRWRGLASMNSSLTCAWISAFLYQESEDADAETSVSLFENILEAGIPVWDDLDHDLSALFSHLAEIPPLNIANLQMQISKFKAAAAFERVMAPSTTDQHLCDEDLQLLEAMLMPADHHKPRSTSDTEFQAILNFLGYAQPQFKMGLWYILLERYESIGDYAGSLLGLTNIFSEAMQSMDRNEPLLQVLSVAHDVGKRLEPLLERYPNILERHWSTSDSQVFMQKIVNLLQALQLFLLYDDAINSNLLQKPITPSWPKVVQKFRELVALWWCIFYRFWLRCMPDDVLANKETINDILSIIHERLGNLGYCGAANYSLLNLHLREISRIDWSGSALDMCQCLKCKFGLNLSLYGDVANHHSVTVALTSEEASQFLPLVMRMIMNHRNFHQAVMRTDTRSVLELLAVKYRKSFCTQRIEPRKNIIKSFLSQDFDLSIVKKAWRGRLETNLSESAEDDAKGLWLIQANIHLNQYRMRRRQAYSVSSIKTESLDAAVELYLDDIAANPSRLESWVGLVYCFMYMCEDCLTFGEEIPLINDPESYCRKALVAGSRAISLKVKHGECTPSEHWSTGRKEMYETASLNVWSLFGYVLLLAVMPPLGRKPFSIERHPHRPLLIELPTNSSLRMGIKLKAEVETKIVLGLIMRCLSAKSDFLPSWKAYLYSSKAAFLMDQNPQMILDLCMSAHKSAPSGVYDAEVELLHMAWDLFRTGKMSADDVREALSALNEDHSIEPPSTIALIQSKLKWLMSKDKWLHRPRFLLAKIDELENNDTTCAQQELLSLFSLKSPTKPLVIWKSEGDLPGQHGVYMSEYIRYMTDLMMANKDSAGLLLMARRFRKTGGEMWNHAETYDYIFTRLCALVRSALPFETTATPRFSDGLMSEVSENDSAFEATVKSLACDLEQNLENLGQWKYEKWTQALFFVNELRRLHSGPSTLAQADELLIILFLTIWKSYYEDHKDTISCQLAMHSQKPLAEVEGSLVSTMPNNKVLPGEGPSKKSEKTAARKKLIRKDVINSAQQFLKPFQQSQSRGEESALPLELSVDGLNIAG